MANDKIAPRILRVIGGIIIITALFTVNYLLHKQDAKKREEVKGVKSAELNLPPAEINSIPVQKNGAAAPEKSWQAALIDTDSAWLLYGKEENQPVAIASLTKLATALVVLEKYHLDEVVTITREAASINGSKIFMTAGDKFTVEDLLNALLIMSANDAAMALAQHKYSQEDFVVLMNQMAKDLGLKNTFFKDPAGLDDQGRSTALEIGLLMARAVQEPKIKEIIRTPEKTIYNFDKTREYKLDNSNRLVKDEMYFEGIIGGKTGFTPEAGHNLVAAAQRDNHTLIAVIIKTYLNTKDASAQAARDLLSWGFDNWEWKKI